MAAETVKEITNPMDGVSACTNPAAIDGGRGRETDEEFRDRYYQSVDYAGGVNADAIAGEIMQNVDAVYSAICYENDTDETDALGLPHSIEAIVYGGLDADIAQAIFRRKAAGIRPPAALLSPSSPRADRASISSFPGRPPLPCIFKSRTWRPTATFRAMGRTASRRPWWSTSAAM